MSKNKWKGVMITESNVDEYLADLVGTKARHITQGVAFSKNDPVQMNLLRLALIKHNSFSGLVKYLLYEYFKNQPVDFEVHPLDEKRIQYLTSKRDRDKKLAKEIREDKTKEPSVIEESSVLEIDSSAPVEEIHEEDTYEIEPVKTNKQNTRKVHKNQAKPKIKRNSLKGMRPS